MRDYEPNERIVNRAVEIWIKLLSGDPKYDNLGPNSPEPPESIHSNTMASTLTSMIPKNNTPDVLKRFGDELRTMLMKPYTWTYKDKDGKEKEVESPPADHLHVDYGPDVTLAKAAKLAGLKMEFPWKTSMALGKDHIWLKHGYAAPSKYHYPLSGDRWLVANLSGDDMPKIIALVESGVLTLELTATQGQFTPALFARRKRHGWHVWGNELANDVEMPNASDKRGAN